MQNNGRYKRRLGNSCFSLKVRNTGIHKGRYIMRKTKQNTKELIPCLISHCAIAVKLATWLSTATLRTPNQLWSLLPDCSHHGIAPMRCCSAESSWLEVKDFAGDKKNSAERFLSSESLLKIYHFPWRKSHVHGEFISTNGHGRIFPRKLLVHILAAWECSPPLPVANVAPSATKPVVPACPPSFQSAAEAWCVVLQWSPSILAQVKPIHWAPGAKHVGEPLCQDCGPPSWGTMEHTAHHIPSPCLGSAQLIFLFCSFFLFTIHCKNKKKGTRFLKLERYIQWKKTNSILKWLSQWWLVICAVSSTW